MLVYTRHEHGNLPVRVRRDAQGQTVYEMTMPSEADPSGKKTLVFASTRQLLASLYGHAVHMPFDHYFRIGRYRQAGRASGQANILTLLDPRSTTRRTDIAVHSPRVRGAKTTTMVVAEGSLKLPTKSESGPIEVCREVQTDLDPLVSEFFKAVREDLRPIEEFMVVTPELAEAFEKSFTLELDRVEGLVGIDLGARSERSGSKRKADEVRRLLWRGFAGKMLSQGYDPDDVLQEIYRGMLARNKGRCPWDARKSTFGHYVHMCIDSILTNYHRKQQRQMDRNALPLTRPTEGEGEVELVWGSSEIHDGSEIGDMLALGGLAKHLEQVRGTEPEAELGRRILPLVASGHQRAEIVQATGEKPSLVSRALAWLREQAAVWARRGDLTGMVPAKYRLT